MGNLLRLLMQLPDLLQLLPGGVGVLHHVQCCCLGSRRIGQTTVQLFLGLAQSLAFLLLFLPASDELPLRQTKQPVEETEHRQCQQQPKANNEQHGEGKLIDKHRDIGNHDGITDLPSGRVRKRQKTDAKMPFTISGLVVFPMWMLPLRECIVEKRRDRATLPANKDH